MRPSSMMTAIAQHPRMLTFTNTECLIGNAAKDQTNHNIGTQSLTPGS